MQTNNLLAPLVQLRKALNTCIVFPHTESMRCFARVIKASAFRVYSAYSPLDRERLINSVLDLYDFVLGSLLSAEFTQKQGIIFRYIMRLMLHIPDSNIQTLRQLMEPGASERFKPYIAQLTGTARAFFDNEFNSRQFEETKRQVARRLYGILENRLSCVANVWRSTCQPTLRM